jgi:hypothetical protein
MAGSIVDLHTLVERDTITEVSSLFVMFSCYLLV